MGETASTHDPYDPSKKLTHLTHRPIVYSALQTDNDTNTSSLTICMHPKSRVNDSDLARADLRRSRKSRYGVVHSRL